MCGEPLGQGSGELAKCAGVGQDPVPARELDQRREGPRAGELHLHHGRLGRLDGVLEGVEVEAHEVDGPAVVAAGPGSHTVAGGHDLDGEVDEQPAVRPIMSAPTPRAGSSARCGRSGSSPTTTRLASPGSVPGSDPMPVATAVAQGEFSTTPLSRHLVNCSKKV
ncbi:hypothetical protein GCM10018954_052650 [Kutzneria kofuensis]